MKPGTVKIYAGDCYADALGAALSAAGAGRATVVLAPDRYTLQAENLILEKLNVSGTFNFGVYSFDRLYYQLRPGADGRKTLVAAQGTMLLQRIITENIKSLKCFTRSASYHSFAAEIYSLIMKMKACGISPEQLQRVSGGQDALSRKLSDIALIMDIYEQQTRGKYSDMTERLLALTAALKSGALADADIIVCGFDRLTVLETRAAVAAVEAGSSLALALYNESELFDEAQTLFPHAEIINVRSSLRGAAQAIKKYLYNPGSAAVAPDGITVTHEENKLSEIEEVARQIVLRVRGGARFSDIAVLCGNLPGSAPLISRVFTEYGINFSLDAPKTLDGHPLYQFLSAALTAKRLSRRAEVIKLVKNPCFPGDKDDKDKFENYVLKFGIDYGGFFRRFEFDHADTPAAESVRREIVRILDCLSDNLPGGMLTLAAEARAAVAEDLAAGAPSPETAEFVRLGFDALESVLTYMSEIYGGAADRPSSVRVEDYAAAFEAGAGQYEVKILPQYADSVTVGGIPSLRLLRPDTVFITDMCDKIMPPEVSDTDILSDAELADMRGQGLSLLPTKRGAERNTRAEILCAMCAARSRLCLTWASSGAAGNAQNPSPLLKRITKIFSGEISPALFAPTSVAFEREAAAAFAPNARVARHVLTEMATRLSDGSAADYSGIAGALYETLADMGQLPGDGLRRYHAPEERLVGAEKLYFHGHASGITQIETFGDCPYRHFAQYGLRLFEREEADIDPIKIGSLLHRVLELFIKRGMRGEEEIFDEVTAPDGEYAALTADTAGRVLTRRLRDEVLAVCAEIRAQQEFSAFLSKHTELKFAEGADLPPLKIPLEKGGELSLTGKIDRVDVWESGGEKYVRIIDYKTGRQPEVPLGNVARGTMLQLPIYLAVLRSCGYRPAGGFYFPVHNDPARNYCMKGFLNKDDGIPVAMDIRLGDPPAASDIVGVRLTKEGKVYANQRWAMESAEFDQFLNDCVEIVRRAARDILSGEIAARPATDKSCGYCPYYALCLPEDAEVRKLPLKISCAEDIHRMLYDTDIALSAAAEKGKQGDGQDGRAVSGGGAELAKVEDVKPGRAEL